MLVPARAEPEAVQEWLLALTSLPRLVCLELNGLSEVSAEVVGLVALHPAGFTAAAQLTRLALDHVSPAAAKLIVGSLTGLRELTLEFERYFGDDPLNIPDVFAAVKLTHMSELSVSLGSAGVSDGAAAALKSVLPQLQSLSVLTRVGQGWKQWSWEDGYSAAAITAT